MLPFTFLVVYGTQSLPPTVLPVAPARLIAYLWLLKPIHTITETGRVDANLEKTPLSVLLSNVSLT